MIMRILIAGAVLATPLAPMAAAKCKTAVPQLAGHCDNLKELPDALAQTLTSTATSLAPSFTLAVQNPYGGEFTERWPDQDGPAITFVP